MFRQSVLDEKTRYCPKAPYNWTYHDCSVMDNFCSRGCSKSYLIEQFEKHDDVMKLQYNDKYDAIKPMKLIIEGELSKLNEFSIDVPDNKYSSLLIPLFKFDYLINIKTILLDDDKIILDISDMPYFTKQHCKSNNFIISFNDSCEIKISMCSTFINFNHSTNDIIKSSDIIYQVIKDIQIKTILNYSNNIKINIDFNGLTKGFFIKCDYEKLIDLKICCNKNEIVKYDKKHIEMFCKIISHNIFYISLDLSHDISDNSLESYLCGIDFSRIEKCSFEFNFTDIHSGIKIYSDSTNYFVLRKNSDKYTFGKRYVQ
jgi:hypothetical protein